MAFNLKEYILFRTEIKRELFNEEVDTNFRMVSNPWVTTRRYEKGNIVYHPVEVAEPTGTPPTTGEPEEHLAWWRANKRTTPGVFDLTQWDIIGGIGGFTDITIAGSNNYGKVLANWQYPLGTSWDTNFNGLLDAPTAGAELKLSAGPGIILGWNDTEQAILITNTGSLGEINHGQNIGTVVSEKVYNGMVANGSNNDLTFKGFTAANVGLPALTVSTIDTAGAEDIEYNFDEAQVTLANISQGSPEINELSDVTYVNLNAGDVLVWDGATWINANPNTQLGNNIYTTDNQIFNDLRVVTLNGNVGSLRFVDPTNGAGLLIDNTGEKFIFGRDAGAASTEFFRFNFTDTAQQYHTSFRNSNVLGGSAIWFETGFNTPGFITGITSAATGGNYSITTGSIFNGAANEDAFTIDQSKNLWVGNWRGNPVEITDVDNERLIPFAKAKGTETGITAVNTGLLFVDDGTGGIAKGSQANALLVNRRLSEFEPRQKVGLAVANTKSDLVIGTDKGQYVGIDVEGYSFNSLQSTEFASAFVGRVYDETSPTGQNASTVNLSTIAYAGNDDLAGPTFPITVGSLVQNRKVDTNANGSLGHVSYLNEGAEIDMGLVAVNNTISNVSRNVGVFSDVINEYANLNDVLYSSEFPNTETKWSGLFVGCVAIKKGGLYLEPQSSDPLCAGEGNSTLWVSDVDNHIYFGDIDLTKGGGATCAAEGLTLNEETECIELGNDVLETTNQSIFTTNREINFGGQESGEPQFYLHLKAPSTFGWNWWFAPEGGKTGGTGVGPLSQWRNVSSMLHLDNNMPGYEFNELEATGLLLSGDRTEYQYVKTTAWNSTPSVLAQHAKFNASTNNPTYFTDVEQDIVNRNLDPSYPYAPTLLGRTRHDGYVLETDTETPNGVSTLWKDIAAVAFNPNPPFSGDMPDSSGGGKYGLLNEYGITSSGGGFGSAQGSVANLYYPGIFDPYMSNVKELLNWVSYYGLSSGNNILNLLNNFSDPTTGEFYGCDPLLDQSLERGYSGSGASYEAWYLNFIACLKNAVQDANEERDAVLAQINALGCNCAAPSPGACEQLCEEEEALDLQISAIESMMKSLSTLTEDLSTLNKSKDYTLTEGGSAQGAFRVNGNIFISPTSDTSNPSHYRVNGGDVQLGTGWAYDPSAGPYAGNDILYDRSNHNNAHVLIGIQGYDFAEKDGSPYNQYQGQGIPEIIPTAMLDVVGTYPNNDGPEGIQQNQPYPFVRFRDLPLYPADGKTYPASNLYADDTGYIWQTKGSSTPGGELPILIQNGLIGNATSLNFLPGPGISLVGAAKGNAVDINITATGGGGGEINTASNVGAGQGLFKGKSGVDLQFYSLTSNNNTIDFDLVSASNVIDLDLGSGANWQKVMGNGSTAVNLTTSVELETTNFIDLNTHEDNAGARMVWDDSPSGGSETNYSQVNAKGVKQFVGDPTAGTYPQASTDLYSSLYQWRIDASATSNSRMVATGSQIQYDAGFIDANTQDHQSSLVLNASDNTSQVYVTTNRYPSVGVQHNLRLGTDADTAEVYMEYSIAKGAAHEVKISAKETKAVISAPLLEIRSESTTGYTLPTSDGAANQVLKTDGSGTATWANLPTAPTGGGLTPVIVTADTTATAGQLIMIDTTTNANLFVRLPSPTTNGEMVGVKWIAQTNQNDAPIVTTTAAAETIDGVNRYDVTGSPLPIKSQWTYLEFIAYVVGDDKRWFIK